VRRRARPFNPLTRTRSEPADTPGWAATILRVHSRHRLEFSSGRTKHLNHLERVQASRRADFRDTRSSSREERARRRCVRAGVYGKRGKTILARSSSERIPLDADGGENRARARTCGIERDLDFNAILPSTRLASRYKAGLISPAVSPSIKNQRRDSPRAIPTEGKSKRKRKRQRTVPLCAILDCAALTMPDRVPERSRRFRRIPARGRDITRRSPRDYEKLMKSLRGMSVA
jgi:hypothetical protein